MIEKYDDKTLKITETKETFVKIKDLENEKADLEKRLAEINEQLSISKEK